MTAIKANDYCIYKPYLEYNRAAYSGADIFFLDDPLSAVDPHVSRQLFER